MTPCSVPDGWNSQWQGADGRHKNLDVSNRAVRITDLVAPYCALPRDYLSDTLWGSWCLNMANWVRYPSPFSERFPLGEHAKVEVRYPPSKGVSQRYWCDTL